MSAESSSLSYRPQLDGLRAVAVMLVFVFHANDFVLRGGFIGVDVFFVLSGYLITRVILSKTESESGFRFTDFYARRGRRLLPAMFLLVIAVAVREAIWGSILEASSRAREVVATLLYVANWNFILEADDYFAAEASASPLRHTWSLAVEEQFYILFPVILIAALFLGTRRKSITPLVLVVLAVISLSLMAILYSPTSVVRVYYGTDTRAFQLLIGALLGFFMHKWRVAGHLPSRRAVAASGWIATGSLLGVLVLAMVLTGTSSAYFHGGSLAVAVVTAMLITSIEVAPDCATSQLLSWRPAVGLGKISYGFYLWHWPIILWVAAPIGASFWDRRIVTAAQFMLTLLVAVGSYYVLEVPIREQRGPLRHVGSRWAVAFGLVGSVTLAVVLGYALTPQVAPLEVSSAAAASAFSDSQDTSITNTGGSDAKDSADASSDGSDLRVTPGRTNEEIAASALADKSYQACPDNPRPCVKYEPSANADIPTVVLIGDSTAQAYDPALKSLAAEYGFRYVQAAVGGCPISHRLLATGADGELHKASNFMCWDELPGIYEEVQERWSPELFIATSWNETNSHVTQGELVVSGTREHHVAVDEGLRDVVGLLGGDAQIAFIHVLPPGPSVVCLETDPPTGERCNRPILPSGTEEGYNAIFDLIASEYPKVVSIDLSDVICPNANCPLMIDGFVVRYDGGHLTATASRALGPTIASRLAATGVHLRVLSGSAG